MKTRNAVASCLTIFVCLAIAPAALAVGPLPDAVIPVAGSTAGASGANFRTEAQLHNPSSSDIRGKLVFVWQGIPIQPNPIAELTYQLAPRQTMVYEDLVAAMGGNGLGSIDVYAEVGVVPTIVVRAFDDQADKGTTGLMVPVLKIDAALTKGRRATLVVPDDLERYRFNIGVRTLPSDEGETILKIVVRDAAGHAIGGEIVKSLPEPFFAQTPGGDFLGQELVAGSSIHFEILSGRAILYSTTTDNTTNDGSIQIDRLLNLAPVVDPLTLDLTTQPSTPVSMQILVADPDDDAVSGQVLEAPANGKLELSETEDGTTFGVTYTPDAGFQGQDRFTLRFEDENGGSTSVVGTVLVTPGNGKPFALGNAYTLVEGTTLSVPAPGVLGNDSDPEGDTLTAVLESAPPNASSFNLKADGSLTYTPNPGFTGPDLFTYRADDGQAKSNVATVRIEVQSANTAPTALPDAASTNEDTPITISVLTNDTDAETPAQLTLVGVTTTGTLGAVTMSGNQVNYDPTGSATLQALAAAATATDTFQYTIQDPLGLTATATVTVTVMGVDDVPTATNDSATLLEDAAATAINVLANDVDIDGGAISIVSVTQGAAGAVVITGGGTGLTYQPNADACGADSFTYTLNGGSVGTVNVTVTCVNDAPAFAKGADQTVLEDSGAQTVNGWATGISAGAANEAGQVLTFTLTNDNNALFSTQPAISATGALTYTPAADANGSATVTVTLSDNGGTANGGVDTSASQTFMINVTAVNDVPSFTKGVDQTVLEDSGAQTVNGWATALSKGPADESTQTLTFNVTGNTNPALFAAGPAIDSSGNLTYTPAADASGSASVTITLMDNGGTANGGVDTSAAQTFTITVTDVNDAPSFTKGADQTVLEDAGAQTVNGWATAISAGTASESGQTLTFNVTGNTNAALFSAGPAISSSGVLTYTTAADANGSATITITLSDDGGTANGGVDTSAAQSFVINVTAVNDAPSFTKGSDQTVLEESGAQTVNGWATALSTGPADESGQTLTFNVTGNTNPALFAAGPAIDSSGNLTYTPAANASGSASVTITLMDDGGTTNGGVDTSAAQTFTITVTDVNDAPSFTKGPDQTVLEDAGAQTVNGWATAISAGPASESGQTLTFNVTGNTNAALFAAGPAISSTGVLTYTPAANANGSATITITLSDNGGTANGGVDTSAAQSFVINVTAVNDVPSFTKGADQSVNENSGAQTVNGWATAISAGPADESGQTLTFNVSNNNNALFSAQPAISSSGNLTYTPATDANGIATVTVSLSDNGGTANGGVDTSANQTFTISVVSVNSAPSFTKGADQTVNEDSGAQTVNGWATSISPGPGEAGQVLTFNVTGNDNAGLFSAGPAINATTGNLTFTPAADAFGVANITITLSDDGGTANGGVDTSASQSFVITVNPVNDVPSFTKGSDQSVLEDAGAQSVVGWATAISVGPANESGQTPTFNVTGNTNAALFSAGPAISSTGTLTYTPAANANGSATIMITVMDDGGTANGGVDTSAAQSFVINVTAVNDAPSFTKGADESVGDNAGAQTVVGWATSISAGAANETGQTLTFNVTGNTNPSIFAVAPAIASNGTLTYTPATVTGVQVATITITLSDDGGTANGGVDTSASQSFTITITHVNSPPTVVAMPKETFDTIGNTAFEFKAAQALSPSIFVSGNLVANFTDSDGPSPLSMSGIVGCADVTSPYDNCATTNGGVVSATSTGEFTFTPKDGDTNASDTFQYTVTDGTTPVSRTVTINRQGRVWYVKNDATAGGLGRSTDPFDTLIEAETASVAGDTIYVYRGDGTSTGQNAGITLKANQRLLGSGVALTMPVAVNGGSNPTTLLTAGTQAVIGKSAGDGVTVANVGGVEIRGLKITGTGNAIDVTTTATNGGGATITNNTIGGAGAEGIDVNAGGSGAMTLVITNNDWDLAGTHTGTAIDIRRTAGTMTLDLSTNTNIVSGGSGIFIDGGAAASSTITGFANNTVHGNTVGAGMTVSNVTFDATAGGNYDEVSGGNTVVGSSGNPVGTSGITMTTVNGHLNFTDLDVFAANGSGLSVTGTGALAAASGTQVTVQNASSSDVSATNGPAVSVSNATLNTVFNALTSTNSSSTGVSLTTVGGTFTAGSGSSITNATGTDFLISGGTANVTYNGTITDATGTVVSVASTTGGTKAFAGAISSGAVSLTNNTGATINFTGGLTLSTGTAAAFTATGGGTVNVTGTTNTLTTTTGTALTVTNTTIGSSNLIFRSISSNGSANGISLQNTGTSGGLKVQSTGASGTGGTIQNTTGAGIVLADTASVDLQFMNITEPGTDGIRVTNINGLTINGCNISDSAGTVLDKGIDIGDFATGTAVNGTISITNSVIGPASGNSPHDSLAVGIGSGTSNWTISGTTFRRTGNSGINLEVRGTASVPTFIVSSNSFAGADNLTSARGVFATTLGTGSIGQLTVQTSTFTNNYVHIDLVQQDATAFRFSILNNTTITGANSHAINVFSSTTSTGGSFTGTIQNNTIGNSVVASSGSAIGNGLRVNINGATDATMLIDNNIVRQTPNGRGMEIIARNGTGGLDATITNNTVDNDAPSFPLADILVQSNCLTVCNTLRSDVRNNTVSNGNTSTDLTSSYLILDEGSTSTLEMVNPGGGGAATCAGKLGNANTGSTSASAGCALITGPIAVP